MTSHRGDGARSRHWRWGLLLALCIGAVACSGSTSVQTQAETPAQESTVATAPTEAPEPTETSEADHTFSAEIMPILEDVCARCHAPGGPGATHWELATAIDATIFAPSIALVTEARVMPPWPASPLSVAFSGDYSLTDEQIASLQAWADAGGLIDVDPDTPIVSTTEVNALLDPEIVAVSSSGPYQGSTDVLDDYRCIIMDLDVDGVEWILQQEFVPDQVEVVHHGIIHLASEEYRQAAQELDDADDGVGWTCHSGSGLARHAGHVPGGYTWQIGGWAPGAGVRSQPRGYGIPLRPGDFLVVQIHYHYDESAPADLSQMRLDLASPAEVAAQPGGRYKTLQGQLYLGPAEIPCYDGDTDPLCDRNAAIERVRDLYGDVSAALPDHFLRQCGSTPERLHRHDRRYGVVELRPPDTKPRADHLGHGTHARARSGVPHDPQPRHARRTDPARHPGLGFRLAVRVPADRGHRHHGVRCRPRRVQLEPGTGAL